VKLSRRDRLLEKALFTLLGRRPFEGGLVLGHEGWLDLKDVVLGLRAMDGVPVPSVRGLEQFFSLYRPERFEYQEGRVRVKPHLMDEGLLHHRVVDPPPLLFLGAKERSLLDIAAKGVAPGKEGWIILFSEEERARRWKGLRTSPVAVVKVLAEKAQKEGCIFMEAGPGMYLVPRLQGRWLEIPQLPEPRKEKPKTVERRAEASTPPPLHPGSFILGDGGLFAKPKRTRKKGNRKR